MSTRFKGFFLDVGETSTSESASICSRGVGCQRQTGFVFRKRQHMNSERIEKRVWFPEWAEVLAQEPLAEGQREAYRRVIVRYLHECKQRRWTVSVASARRFMETVERKQQPSAPMLSTWKEGLNWFSGGRRSGRRGGWSGRPGADERHEAGTANWKLKLASCSTGSASPLPNFPPGAKSSAL